MIYLAAMTVGSHLVLAADVPKFNAEPSCKAAAATAVMVGRTSENCMEDERNARGLIDKSWADYSAADKVHCLSLLNAGGAPSYVELLSCLEMSRDARRIAHDQPNDRSKRPGDRPPRPGAETTGAGSGKATGEPPTKP